MDIRRVAVIFDDQSRPETTGVYCRRALGRWSRSSISGPTSWTRSLGRASTSTSTSTTAWNTASRRPAALRLVGDRHPPELRLVPARRPATSISSSPPSATAPSGSRPRGSPRLAGCRWPAIPRSTASTTSRRPYDIAFVGNVFPGPRAELLEPAPPAVPPTSSSASLLRGDGPDLLGRAARLQPQHQERRQHAGLRGLALAARCC